jgi:hypothetical protein
MPWAPPFTRYNPLRAYRFTQALPDSVILGRAYTFEITYTTYVQVAADQTSVISSTLNNPVRNPYASSVGTGLFDVPGILTAELVIGATPVEDDPGAIELTDTTRVNTFPAPLIHGRVRDTIIFQSGGTLVAGSRAVLRFSTPNGVVVLRHFFTVEPPGIEWTTQPLPLTEQGLPLGVPAVSFVDSAGDVITGETSNVTVEAVRDDGFTPVPATSGILRGTLTVAAVAGVATFSDLTYDGVGTIKLRASSGTIKPVVSNPIEVQGIEIPDTITGLRQNIAEDGTTWVKTAGVASPAPTVTSATERLILDGDVTQNDTVTARGIRVAFAYPLLLRSLFLRGILSAIDASSDIAIYTSLDTTNATDGTWTLLTTISPRTVNVNQGVSLGEVNATSPRIRGLWITLID